MTHNSYKMNDVKNIFGGYRSILPVKNDFWTVSMKFLPMGEKSSSAKPYHFTHFLRETCSDKNIWKYQYEDRYNPLKLQVCRKI